MPITVEGQGVIAPSKFRVVCESVTDAEGKAIDLASTLIEVIFFDRNENEYRCVHNPFPDTLPVTNNTRIDGDGHLNLIFEDYTLHRGKVAYILHTRVADANYETGYCDSFTKKQDSGIILD